MREMEVMSVGNCYITGSVPADGDLGLGELLDLSHERALDMHELDNDNRQFLHTVEEITGLMRMCQGDSVVRV